MLSTRLRVSLCFAIIIYFLIILTLLKRKSLNLKYSLLWLASGAILGAFAIFPNLLVRLSHTVGIMTAINGILVSSIAFILMILMSITSIVSRQNSKIRTLVQDNAILEKRIRELENIINNIQKE